MAGSKSGPRSRCEAYAPAPSSRHPSTKEEEADQVQIDTLNEVSWRAFIKLFNGEKQSQLAKQISILLKNHLLTWNSSWRTLRVMTDVVHSGFWCLESAGGASQFCNWVRWMLEDFLVVGLQFTSMFKTGMAVRNLYLLALDLNLTWTCFYTEVPIRKWKNLDHKNLYWYFPLDKSSVGTSKLLVDKNSSIYSNAMGIAARPTLTLQSRFHRMVCIAFLVLC